MARRKDGAGKKKAPEKKKSRGRGDGERRRRAYFYAQENPICQLLEDRELGWETIVECFLTFFKKLRMGKRNRVLLEMLSMYFIWK